MKESKRENKDTAIRYPLGTSSFERIRKMHMVYVDKTAYIHKMTESFTFVFLARPRRFGKSMLVSTLEQFFLGNRELFKGLDIDRLEPQEWPSFPVLHLDLTGVNYQNDDSLEKHLSFVLEDWENQFQLEHIDRPIEDRFLALIRNIYDKTGKKVVVLIDEYDTPLTSSINRPELQKLYRHQLHAFYSVLKKADPFLQFCMLTGVSRFGKLSIFSGLNNLSDISFADDYAGICGITYDELSKYYARGIEEFAEKNELNRAETFELLKFNYDGYHFSPNMLDVYNPYSINNAMHYNCIKDYWCQSGAPMLLSKSLLHIDFDLEKLTRQEVDEATLSDLSVHTSDPLPLFYQTGYLTLKSYDPETELFKVGYPNREVERGILKNVLQVYVPEETRVSTVTVKMRRYLEEGEPEKFIIELKSYLSGIPSRLRSRVSRYENYYHTIFYCLVSLLGMNVEAEHNTSEGFIDLLIKTKEYIYIIELKVNGSAKDAIEQIDGKHYASKFDPDRRNIIKIGIGFSKSTGSIEDYIINLHH